MIFKPEHLSGWGNIPHHPALVAYPQTIEDLKSLPSPILARGLGRSYADQATFSSGHIVKTERFNHFLAFDESTGVLTAEAGVSLQEIISVFAPRGWFPMITPGTKFVTLGGAIANDVHGKAHHVDGSFINCVHSFTILLASGEVLTASREQHADLFFANFGGMGLLGIILTVTLALRKIETTYFRQEAITASNLEAMLEAIEQADTNYTSSVAWIDSLATGTRLGRGVLTMGNLATLNELPEKLKSNPLRIGSPAKVKVPLYMPSFTLNPLTIRILNFLIYTKQKSAAPFTHYESFFYPLDTIIDWNKGYGKRGFIQYQFVIPIKDAAKNIRTILEMIAGSGCKPFLNVLKKFGPGAQDAVLSFPEPGYTFAIDFPVVPKLKAFTQQLDKTVLEMNGRIYLGKDAWLDDISFRKMYPLYPKWLEVKKHYDPGNVFNSDLGKRLRLGEP